MRSCVTGRTNPRRICNLPHRNVLESEEEVHPGCSPQRKYRSLLVSVSPIGQRVNCDTFHTHDTRDSRARPNEITASELLDA